MPHWVEACSTIDIEEEGVRRFDHGDATYAIYRSPEDAYYATAGLCTHQHVHLADGVVMEHVVECPKHSGLFDYTTGEPMGAPVCISLATYPVKVENALVYIDIDATKV